MQKPWNKKYSSLRTQVCSPYHVPGLLELWAATPQVFRLSAPSKAGLPKALLNTEGSVGVDVNELYFKYQRLLNKENGCFSINLSVFIVNSWPCYSESLGRHSCMSVLWGRFPMSVSGHSQTHCSWNLGNLWSCGFLCSCSGACSRFLSENILPPDPRYTSLPQL